MKYASSVLSLFSLLVALTSCVTAPGPSGSKPSGPTIAQIKERLKLVREVQDLGFDEKTFNACDLGLKAEDCTNEFLTVIHFQLVCRESEGTVSEVPTDLIPIQSDAISWKLGDATGVTQSDAQGFGKVEVRRPVSSATSRLRLTIEDRFVATPARETTRIVVPQDWCPSRN